MSRENYNDTNNYDEEYDGYSGEYEDDDPEVYLASYADEDSEDGEYIEDWADERELESPPAHSYYSLHPSRQSEYLDRSGYPAGSPPHHPAGYFSAAPGPGCIAVATILVCLSMGLFLLRLAAGIQVPQVAPPAEAIAAQPAAAEPPATVAEPPFMSPEAANTPCQVSSLFPEKVLRWCNLISYYANQHSLSPDLIAALVWLESGGDELAYSRSGAVGLMQVMPSDGLASSFMCVNGPCFSDRPTIVELQNPEFNIAWGTRFLAGLQRRHGDLRQALRSYGPMNVGFSYADKVLGLFEKYKTPAPTP